MSTLFTAKQICEEALRKIGAYAINDTAADDEHVRLALGWLDLLMAELSGTTRCWWLVTREITVPLDTADQRTYDLAAVTAAEGLQFQFPVSAALVDDAGNRAPLELWRSDQYDAVSKLTTSGNPCGVYIDRLTGLLCVHPVPAITTLSVALTIQTFANSLVQDNRVTGVQDSDASHGLRASWQMWAIYRLAGVLGDGTIRRCSTQEQDRHLRMAEISEAKLMAFENREHDSSFQIAFRDF